MQCARPHALPLLNPFLVGKWCTLAYLFAPSNAWSALLRRPSLAIGALFLTTVTPAMLPHTLSEASRLYSRGRAHDAFEAGAERLELRRD